MPHRVHFVVAVAREPVDITEGSLRAEISVWLLSLGNHGDDVVHLFQQTGITIL